MPMETTTKRKKTAREKPREDTNLAAYRVMHEVIRKIENPM
jgi:hypothetical protein